MRRRVQNKAAQGFGIMAVALLMVAMMAYMLIQMMGYR